MFGIDVSAWRDTPLDENELALLNALFLAHHQSSFRNNPSSQAVVNAARGGASYANSIASALLSLGGKHAPLERICEFLSHENAADEVPGMLAAGMKVPGWGTSFSSGEPDPIWAPVSLLIEEMNPNLNARMNAVTRALINDRKVLFPNPGAFTAATALTLRIPVDVAPLLFVMGRITAWSQLFHGEVE